MNVRKSYVIPLAVALSLSTLLAACGGTTSNVSFQYGKHGSRIQRFLGHVQGSEAQDAAHRRQAGRLR